MIISSEQTKDNRIIPTWNQAWKWILIGVIWAAATSPIILSPVVRETVRMYLGDTMTLLFLILPIVWATIFDAWILEHTTADYQPILAGFTIALLLGALAAYILCIIYNARMRYKRQQQETLNNQR